MLLKPRFNVDYLLKRGMNVVERRRLVVAEDQKRLKPLINDLVNEVGEQSAARTIGIGHATMIKFIASEQSVPLESTINKVKKHFEGKE